jgi:hypothetical protein
MEITLKTLLTKPSIFFEKFNELPPKWIISYCGYFLITFVEAIGNLVYQDAPASVLSIFIRGFLSSFLGAFLNILIFGVLWMALGSKIFGGAASFKAIVQAVGYAFFYPGLFSLITVPLMLASVGLGGDTTIGIALTCVVLSLQFALGLWAMVHSAIAIKNLNHFSWAKTLGVIAWFPIVLIMTAVVITATIAIFR